MIETVESFMNQIGPDQKGYLKKTKGTSKIFLWWEDEERWFCNVQHWSPRNKEEKPSWMIAKDLREWLEFMRRQGYQMFLE